MKTKRWLCLGAVTAAWVAGCGSSPPTGERAGVTSAPIQGGATDSTHTFVVGVVQYDPQSGTADVCTGSLLAPNLVVTARHCVAQISSPQIDCSQATFGALVPEANMLVTPLTTIPQMPKQTDFVGVVSGGIIVPSASLVCGNDIALLILNQKIALPGGYPAGYVVPAITPALTDPSRSTTVTAIGYGVVTPTDEASVTAGTRRIKENVGLACIPNDPNFIDCYSDPACLKPTPTCTAKKVLTPAEFISGDMTTCEGDSGSGVFDQAAFNAGSWVSYGVLSRGGVSTDGLNCIQPVYTRFDAWGSLLADAAKRAAALGGYTAPAWATAPMPSLSDAGGTSPPDSGSAAIQGDGGSSTGPVTVGANGTPCGSDSACLSNACVAYDGTHFYCASPCGEGGACPSQFVCEGSPAQSYCFPESSAPSTSGSSGGGCSAGGRREAFSAERDAAWLFVALGGWLGVARRTRRRSRRILSGS